MMYCKGMFMFLKVLYYLLIIPFDSYEKTINHTIYLFLEYLLIILGWWFQPLWKILVNGKDYPIYYGKKNETTNQCFMFLKYWVIISDKYKM